MYNEISQLQLVWGVVITCYNHSIPNQSHEIAIKSPSWLMIFLWNPIVLPTFFPHVLPRFFLSDPQRPTAMSPWRSARCQAWQARPWPPPNLRLKREIHGSNGSRLYGLILGIKHDWTWISGWNMIKPYIEKYRTTWTSPVKSWLNPNITIFPS